MPGWTADMATLETGSGGATAEEIVAAIKADPVIGIDGVVKDARETAEFHRNRREIEVISATQWRYSIYRDDQTTVSYRLDFNPTTASMVRVA